MISKWVSNHQTQLYFLNFVPEGVLISVPFFFPTAVYLTSEYRIPVLVVVSLQIVNDFCMNISIFKIKDVPQLFLNDECSYILFFYYFILQRFDKTFVSHDWNR